MAEPQSGLRYDDDRDRCDHGEREYHWPHRELLHGHDHPDSHRGHEPDTTGAGDGHDHTTSLDHWPKPNVPDVHFARGGHADGASDLEHHQPWERNVKLECE